MEESFKIMLERKAEAKLYSFVGLESNLDFILKITRKDRVVFAKKVT